MMRKGITIILLVTKSNINKYCIPANIRMRHIIANSAPLAPSY